MQCEKVTDNILYFKKDSEETELNYGDVVVLKVLSS